VEQFFTHADTVAIFAIFAMSLNLLLGYAGQISIAHAAFGAVGAYTAGYLAVNHGWAFFPALLLGMAAAFIVGVLTSLPALYLDVRYLILLTLALSTAVLAVIGAVDELGGSYGLRGVPDVEIFGKTFDQPSEFFQLLIVLVVIVLAVCWRLAYSPFGRVLRAIRDDELATRGVGKNVVFYKVMVFGLTSAMAGMAGVMLTYFNQGAQPGAYGLAQSVAIIAMVVIGGTANLLGSILGATLLVLLEPFLEDTVALAPTDAAPARLSIYGGLIVLFLFLRPQGLIPERWTPATMWRELRRFPGRLAGRAPAPATGVSSGPFTAPNQHAQGVSVHNHGERHVPSGPHVVSMAGPPPASDDDAGNVELEASDLKKHFGGIRAADGLSLRLLRGRVTGLIGPNGAGKTTVFNLLTGVIPFDEGSVRLKGHDITGWTLNRIAKAGMARSYQDLRIYPRMSVLENVMIAVPDQPGEQLTSALFRPGRTRRGEAEVRSKALNHLELVGLADRADNLVSTLAFGEQKLVALARLVATEADVLLLDEPASGIDVAWVERMLALIAELRARGKSVCVVEHNLHVVERVADWIYFMEAGRITAEGTMRELLGQERLAEVYFGSA
jgi:branched-chain amino acid transport system permease protein